MLKRGGKSSYNPYSTGQRVKKGRDRLDILPNKHGVWLKQVSLRPPFPPPSLAKHRVDLVVLSQGN